MNDNEILRKEREHQEETASAGNGTAAVHNAGKAVVSGKVSGAFEYRGLHEEECRAEPATGGCPDGAESAAPRLLRTPDEQRGKTAEIAAYEGAEGFPDPGQGAVPCCDS